MDSDVNPVALPVACRYKAHGNHSETSEKRVVALTLTCFILTSKCQSWAERVFHMCQNVSMGSTTKIIDLFVGQFKDVGLTFLMENIENS